MLAAITEARHSGARLVFGGERPAHVSTGNFLQPTIFADTPVDSALWRDEVFGPVVALRPFDDEPEAGSGSV